MILALYVQWESKVKTAFKNRTFELGINNLMFIHQLTICGRLPAKKGSRDFSSSDFKAHLSKDYIKKNKRNRKYLYWFGACSTAEKQRENKSIVTLCVIKTGHYSNIYIYDTSNWQLARQLPNSLKRGALFTYEPVIPSSI